MNTLSRYAIPVIVLFTFSSAPAADNASSKPADNDCAFSISVSNWRMLDSRHIVIWAPAFDPYLLELMSPVHDLAFSESLTVIDNDHDGRICAGDEVAAPRHSGGSFPSHITSMRHLSPDDLKTLGEQYHMQLAPKPKNAAKDHDKQPHE